MKKATLCTSIFLLSAFTGAHAQRAAVPPPAKPADAAAQHATVAPSSNPAAAKDAKRAEAPKQQLQEVAYEDLGRYVNQHIVVHTTLRTERSGTLVKYSQTSIDMKLDSGATLGLPRETIKNVGVPIAPPDPLFPEKK